MGCSDIVMYFVILVDSLIISTLSIFVIGLVVLRINGTPTTLQLGLLLPLLEKRSTAGRWWSRQTTQLPSKPPTTRCRRLTTCCSRPSFSCRIPTTCCTRDTNMLSYKGWMKPFEINLGVPSMILKDISHKYCKYLQLKPQTWIETPRYLARKVWNVAN